METGSEITAASSEERFVGSRAQLSDGSLSEAIILKGHVDPVDLLGRKHMPREHVFGVTGRFATGEAVQAVESQD